MRKSSYDVVIILICGCFLYYYIFIYGFPRVDCEELNILMPPDKCFLIHEGIVWSSLFAVMFMFIYVFGDILLPFNRYYVIRYYHVFLRDCKKKIKEGKRLTKEYFDKKR